MATSFGLDNPQGAETPGSVRRDRKPVFKLFIAGSTILLLRTTLRLTGAGRYIASVVWYKGLSSTKGATTRSTEEDVRDREEVLNLQLDREAVHLARTVASVFDASAEPVREFRRLAGLAP